MKTEELDRLKQLTTPVFFKAGVKKAILFGSCAQDSETKRSDIDLVIIKETSKRFFDRYDEFNAIYDLMPNMAIDLLIYTPEELEDIFHRSFIKRILKEGKILYESSKESA